MYLNIIDLRLCDFAIVHCKICDISCHTRHMNVSMSVSSMLLLFVEIVIFTSRVHAVK